MLQKRTYTLEHVCVYIYTHILNVFIVYVCGYMCTTVLRGYL